MLFRINSSKFILVSNQETIQILNFWHSAAGIMWMSALKIRYPRLKAFLHLLQSALEATLLRKKVFHKYCAQTPRKLYKILKMQTIILPPLHYEPILLQKLKGPFPLLLLPAIMPTIMRSSFRIRSLKGFLWQQTKTDSSQANCLFHRFEWHHQQQEKKNNLIFR